MNNKKRILFVTESHKLASGFGTYAKEVIQRLYDTGKYEIAQFACYSPPSAFQNTDWLIYGVAPMPHEEQYKQQHAHNPAVQWGLARFEHAVLDFKPDIVVTYRDPWMDAYISDSVLLPFFHWVWMPTVDSEPQKSEWLYWFEKCDGLMAYSEYGIRVLDEQTHGRLKPVGCASPAIDPNTFNIIPNKQKHKEQFGLPADSFIVGTVMRNQKRKMFPELMKAFKTFLDTAPAETRNKSFLYLHTSYPEKHGWDITSLIHEYGIGSKVLSTYTCRACNKYFVAHWRDAITICDHCGKYAATLPSVSNGIDHKELVNVYNLMDLYVQYAICLGKDEEILIKRNNQKQWCPISQVMVGDKAWTHKNRWRSVTDVWKNLSTSCNKKVLELSVCGDYDSLLATENHEFPAYTSKEIKNDRSRSVREKIGDRLKNSKELPQYGKYELSALQKGDMLLYPIDDTVKDVDEIDLANEVENSYLVTDNYIEVVGGFTYPRKIKVDNDFCKFLGLFAADGSYDMTQNKKGIKITSHINEPQNHLVATNFFDKAKISNVDSVRKYKDREGQDNALWSKLYAEVFEKWFSKKENKSLPDWTMELPTEKQKNILIGMFMGDGHYCENKNYSQISTSSKPLADQIKTLLRRLRIPFSVCKMNRSQHQTKDNKNRVDSYSFEIYGFNIKNGEISTSRRGTNNVYYGSYHLMKIKSIKETDYKDDVWCITVDEDHTMTTKVSTTFQCEGFGMPQVEAAACGVPIASVDYSAMEDVVKFCNGYPISASLEREMETNADRSRANAPELVNVFLHCSKQQEDQRKKQRIKTRQGCISRYTWDNAAKAWEEYFDKVEKKGIEGQWDHQPLMKPIPKEYPKDLNHQQFCEWMTVNVIQDQSYAFSHKMLDYLRNLNFGATFGNGKLDPCTQDSVFQECLNLAERRFLFDQLRVNETLRLQQQQNTFLQEAHRRLKK